MLRAGLLGTVSLTTRSFDPVGAHERGGFAEKEVFLLRKTLHRGNFWMAGRVLVLAGASAFFLLSVAPAQDYSLEYAIVGVSAEVSQTADYHVVEQVGIQGVVIDVQSSADYSGAPVLDILAGPGSSEPPAAVEFWMFF